MRSWIIIALVTVAAVLARPNDLQAAPASPPRGAAPAPASPTAPTTPAPSAPPTVGHDKPVAPIHAPPKTRPGSVLKSDKLLPVPADGRSDAERRRDLELRTHFSRQAELDVIAAIASQRGDTRLEEEVELVRRKEVQRHQRVMMAARKSVLDGRAPVAAAPAGATTSAASGTTARATAGAATP